MKIATPIVVIFALLLGGAGGSLYVSKHAEEQYAYNRMEQLYRESALEIKTYAKLLRLMRNGEHERVVKYLEALLSSAEGTLAATESDVPESVKNTAGRESLNYLTQYRVDFPLEGSNEP